MIDWDYAMDATKALAEKLGLSWAEVRFAATEHVRESDPYWDEAQGVGSSDANHMIFGLVQSGEIVPVLVHAAEVKDGREARRKARLADLSARTGVAPELLEQQLRELLS